jgi:flagellar biosynthesis/type III secretory pathway ATPase
MPGEPSICRLIRNAATRAADGHATARPRIADRYRLPAVTVMISIHRALRTAVDGDMATAEQLYRRAAAELDRLGLWQYGAGVAARPRPIRRDILWLFMTGVRGLLAIAIDDLERAESADRRT